ncbi:hypothetical protein QQX98_008767 [Neonectria punicea]|uniref:MACPF domain-containing protein n=1 Tax=Neonectria punicea TaxID=979145 RepID=A0ABR1GUA3_9HYPO
MSSKESIEHQGGDKSEHERQDDGQKASKKQFSFNEEFDVFLKEIAPSDGNKDPAMVSSRLITFNGLQDKAAKDGYSLRNLPLSKLRSSFRNSFFCLKSKDMTQVDSSMTLKDYKDRENEPDNGERSRQSMNVYWTRSFQGDLKKVLDNVPDTGKLPDDKDKPSKPDTSFPEYKSALSTEQSIKMERPKENDSLYGLSRDNWSHVVEGNQLLYAFQVDKDLAAKLQGQSLEDFLAVQPDKKSTPDGTNQGKPTVTGEPAKEETPQDPPNEKNLLEPVDPKSPSVFIINPNSGIGSSEKNEHASETIHAGLFWSSPNVLSTTKIIKIEDTVQQWSLQSGMSSQSFNAGLSFPIGKATVGAKFGFEREQSHKNEQKSMEHGSAITALHLIPTAQINISETTVLLSPDAEADIKRLRQKRRFSDLLSFLMKYGTQIYQTITLGGQLYHAQCLNTTGTQHEEEQTNRVKKSMNASLGIPDLVEVTTGYSKENMNTNVQGERQEHTKENMSWSGLGGNPTLIVE